MSKLENIKRSLQKHGGVNWIEQSARREHLRREGEYYWMVGLQVVPKKQILDSENLQRFSKRIIDTLSPIAPVNISQCYEYAESRRDVIKTAAVYFTEAIEEPGEDQGSERRIAVSVYPCRVMAENMGIRGTIDMGHFECPDPCSQAKNCAFRARFEGFIYQAARR